MEVAQEGPQEAQVVSAPKQSVEWKVMTMEGQELGTFVDEPYIASDDGAEATKWTYVKVKSLIRSYKEHIPMFNNPELKKKEVWRMVAARVSSFGHVTSADSCDQKWRALVFRYKKIYESDNVINRKRRWEYYDLMDEILAGYQPAKQTVDGELIQTANEKSTEAAKVAAVHLAAAIKEAATSAAAALQPQKKASSSTSSKDQSQKKRKREDDSQAPQWFRTAFEKHSEHAEELLKIEQQRLIIQQERNNLLKEILEALKHKK